MIDTSCSEKFWSGKKGLPGWMGATTARKTPLVIKHRNINPVIMLDLIRKDLNNMHLLTKGLHGTLSQFWFYDLIKLLSPKWSSWLII